MGSEDSGRYPLVVTCTKYEKSNKQDEGGSQAARAQENGGNGHGRNSRGDGGRSGGGVDWRSDWHVRGRCGRRGKALAETDHQSTGEEKLEEPREGENDWETNDRPCEEEFGEEFHEEKDGGAASDKKEEVGLGEGPRVWLSATRASFAEDYRRPVVWVVADGTSLIV